MRNDVRGDWASVDQLMWKIRHEQRFLDRITPQNVGQERTRFLQHWQDQTPYNPDFRYDQDTYNASTVHEQLDRCATLLTDTGYDPRIFPLYEHTLDELFSTQTILTNLGDDTVATEESTALYGEVPTQSEVQTAQHVLETIREQDRPGTRRASDLHTACTTLLEQSGLTDWAVTYTGVPYPSASAAEKVLRVPHPAQGQRYLFGEPTAIAAHEVSHGLRAANGYAQPYNLFATGINQYPATDEGLSILLEFSYNDSPANVRLSALRRYALRVIAADAAAQGATYWETFSTLMNYTGQEREAWNVTLRAYRAGSGTYGGVIKDHIYQRGLSMVAAMLVQSDDPETVFETLYLGKYGLHDFSTVRQLQNQGVLNAPTHMPFSFIGADDILQMAERVVDQDLGAVLQPA